MMSMKFNRKDSISSPVTLTEFTNARHRMHQITQMTRIVAFVTLTWEQRFMGQHWRWYPKQFGMKSVSLFTSFTCSVNTSCVVIYSIHLEPFVYAIRNDYLPTDFSTQSSGRCVSVAVSEQCVSLPKKLLSMEISCFLFLKEHFFLIKLNQLFLLRRAEADYCFQLYCNTVPSHGDFLHYGSALGLFK